MAHVDVLSQPPHCMRIQNSVHLQFLKAQQADDQITAIKTLLETTPHENYIVKNKLLYKTANGNDLLMVPDKMQANIIKTAHKHHLGPPATTSKKHKHVFAVIDAFSKFTWLYPTKSTDSSEAINQLENQRHVFRNPARIITDKGSAFTSSAFEDYCNKHKTYFISPLQLVFQDLMAKLENTISLSLLCCQNFLWIILRNAQFQQQHDAPRQDGKKQIYQVQDENPRTSPAQASSQVSTTRPSSNKRTQFGPGLKLKQKYLGSYEVTKVKHNDTDDVEKCDFVDGPYKTSTCAEFMNSSQTRLTLLDFSI
ncbi:transposon Ty3-I Gag-Pol polyprotein [Trichonephila inaurata madagascariensis]|uniref:Transposon Ty3-I Gag-Pol polyprotein n=1 Tax=Trichonephila inaurata madagascariensis TaxID=2747483 RepID=A0A8X6M600_9ARAC|nr:transposon Ty3-I Gag-Pol polyprotein [Trichonephila inaurata madagascariensis]